MSTTPDYRALCADAAARYREALKTGDSQSTYNAAVDWMLAATYAAKSHTSDASLYPDIAAKAADCVRRARALLDVPEAEAEAVGVTDEELDALERQCWVPTEVCDDAGCEYLLDHRRFARAVLSRFAHPAPVPIPSELVTEALRDEWFGRYEFQTRHPLGLLPVAAEHGYRLGYQAAIAGPAPVPVGERLPGDQP